ncbi:MAG: acyl-CoA dehydrogenase family protein [Terriglobia bacterium]
MYRLSEKQSALVEEIRHLAEETIAPWAAEVDEKGRFPRESVNALARHGFLGLSIGSEYGGMGEAMRTACASLEEVARCCASTGMIYLMHLCGCACYSAHPRDHEDTLRQAAKGEHLSTLAWSEKGSRSHFWAPVSQAAKKDGSILLQAQKSWVTSAGEADGYVVSTRTDGGKEATDTVLYLVRRGDAGLRVSGSWNSLGMRGNASAPMTLDDCEIPLGRALCEPSQGFPRMLEILPWFNLGNAAISIAIAEAATQATTAHLTSAKLDHLNSRLSDLPNLRARLAQMRIETDRARSYLVAALDALEARAANAMLFVLGAKASCAEACLRVTDMGMQACGGAAFSKHLSLERNFRDARASSVMAPTSDVLHEFVGRALCGMNLF